MHDFKAETKYKIGKRKVDENSIDEYVSFQRSNPQPQILSGSYLIEKGYDTFSDFIRNATDEGFKRGQTLTLAELREEDGGYAFITEETVQAKAISEDSTTQGLHDRLPINYPNFEMKNRKLDESTKRLIESKDTEIQYLRNTNIELREQIQELQKDKIKSIEEMISEGIQRGTENFKNEELRNKYDELKAEKKKQDKELEEAQGLADGMEKFALINDVAEKMGLHHIINLGMQKFASSMGANNPQFAPQQPQNQPPPQQQPSEQEITVDDIQGES